MVSYITTVGLSPEAVVNGIWAAISRNVKIDELILFGTDSSIEKSIPLIREKIGEIAPELARKMITVPIPEEDVVKIIGRMKKVIDERRRKGQVTCIDITGGRKTMSAAALASAYLTDAAFVYYFWLKDMKKQGLFYPELEDEDYEFVRVPVIGVPDLDKYKKILKMLEVSVAEMKRAKGLGIDSKVLKRLEHHGYIEIKGGKIRITDLGKALLKVL